MNGAYVNGDDILNGQGIGANDNLTIGGLGNHWATGIAEKVLVRKIREGIRTGETFLSKETCVKMIRVLMIRVSSISSLGFPT